MRLKDRAQQQGIHSQTARNWFRCGTLPVSAVQTPSGTILVQPDAGPAPGGGLGLCARVSPMSSGPTGPAGRPAHPGGRLRAATARVPLVRVEAEVASGVTERQAGLRRLLADPAVGTVVTHRDRLTRMNAELVRAALSAHGRRLVVLEDGEVTGDLVQVPTSYCARLYGRESACNRALKAARCAQRDVGPAGVAAAAGDDGDRVLG